MKENRRCGTCRFSEYLRFRTEYHTVPLVCVEGKKMILVRPSWGKKCNHWKPREEGKDGHHNSIQ